MKKIVPFNMSIVERENKEVEFKLYGTLRGSQAEEVLDKIKHYKGAKRIIINSTKMDGANDFALNYLETNTWRIIKKDKLKFEGELQF